MYSFNGDVFLDLETGDKFSLDGVVDRYKSKGLDVEVMFGDAEIFFFESGVFKKEIREGCTIVRFK